MHTHPPHPSYPLWPVSQTHPLPWLILKNLDFYSVIAVRAQENKRNTERAETGQLVTLDNTDES